MCMGRWEGFYVGIHFGIVITNTLLIVTGRLNGILELIGYLAIFLSTVNGFTQLENMIRDITKKKEADKEVICDASSG